MEIYKPQKFNLPSLEGMSEESVTQHIGLYEGYVKNFNAMTEEMDEFFKDPEKHALALSELVRRRSFEFDGMRLHELYFPQFEGGGQPLDETSPMARALSDQFSSIDEAIKQLRFVGMVRGPGWSMLYWDPKVNQFRIGFTEQQQQGVFATLPVIVALDVWEHAYILDYGAAGRAKYIDAFFKNLNWETVEKRFAQARS